MNGALTPGELHNLIVQNYVDSFGLDTVNVITYASVKQMQMYLMTKFVNEQGLALDSITAFVNKNMHDMWDNNYFNATDATFALTITEYNSILANDIGNGNIKTAWLNIINSTSEIDFDSHYDNAETQLKGITGTTTNEQTGIDGSLSVLGSSYVVFRGLTSYQKATIIADSDAMGYAKGWEIGINSWWGGYDLIAVGNYAAYMSASCSILAARIVL